jgi:ubiquitin C-terminal hydrolase
MDEMTSSRAVPASSACDQCNDTDRVTELKAVREYPLILVVTLLRFDGDSRKIDDFIAYPDKLAIEGGMYSSQLCGMIEHEGKVTTHGHFVGFVTDQNDDWYREDDLCAFRAKRETVMNARPYILVYKRII